MFSAGISLLQSVLFTLRPRTNPGSRRDFFEEVSNLLSQLQCTDITLGGDFNCIINTNLDKNKDGDDHPQSEQGRNALRSLMEELNLTDVWRVRHPQRKNFTFRRGSYSSRLDLFLISQHLTDSTKTDNIVLTHSSDHSLIDLVL